MWAPNILFLIIRRINMKRVRIEIDEKGNYTMDLLEGFSGMSCSQKAKELQVLLGGDTQEETKKPEYFDPEGDNFDELFINK